jgi:hypothetical protein
MNKLACASLMVLLAAAPARADNFCAALKAVVADAPGFATIRGPRSGQEENGVASYPTPKVRIHGDDCGIAMTGASGTYRCILPHGSDGKSDAAALSGKVQACLAVTPNVVDQQSDRSTFVFQIGPTVVNIYYGDDIMQLILWVGPPEQPQN